jgi:thioredoxin 1
MPEPGHVEHIDDLNFEREVLESSEPYLLDFSAQWCSPCRALDPIIESIAQEYQGKLRVGRLDIDSSPAVAARFGVRGAPTVLLFQRGQETGRRLGLTKKSALLALAGL